MKLLVNGKSGFGKTFYVKRRIKNEKKNYVIFTPYPEDYITCGIIITDYDSLKTYINDNENYKIIFPMSIYDYKKNYVILHNFCFFIFQKNEPCLVVIDEIQNLRIDKNNQISIRGDLPVTLYRLIDEGRHFDISVICIARRPVQFTPLLQSLADEYVTFRLTSKNDLNKIEEYFGMQTYIVCTLPKFYALRHKETEEFNYRIFPDGTERRI
jgi:DNA helicase HerA-like ATPase